MQNRAFGPYLAAINRILISVVYISHIRTRGAGLEGALEGRDRMHY
jgi:hypothetical protein